MVRKCCQQNIFRILYLGMNRGSIQFSLYRGLIGKNFGLKEGTGRKNTRNSFFFRNMTKFRATTGGEELGTAKFFPGENGLMKHTKITKKDEPQYATPPSNLSRSYYPD